jgi:hypothetical protein
MFFCWDCLCYLVYFHPNFRIWDVFIYLHCLQANNWPVTRQPQPSHTSQFTTNCCVVISHDKICHPIIWYKIALWRNSLNDIVFCDIKISTVINAYGFINWRCRQDMQLSVLIWYQFVSQTSGKKAITPYHTEIQTVCQEQCNLNCVY